MKTKLIVVLLVLLILISGCIQSEYVCPDGKTVANPSECKKMSDCGNGVCESDFDVYYPGETHHDCPQDCTKGQVQCTTDGQCYGGACVNGKCIGECTVCY